jgi:peptidoglycan/LPS O-acetylase OafA/YrhL
MLRSIASVMAGYVIMAAIVVVGTIIAAASMIPGGLAAAKKLETPPPRKYLNANLALSFVAALAGGWVTAMKAPVQPVVHVLVLAALVLAMSFVSAKSQGKNQPSWYPLVMTVLGVAGVLLGGFWQIWSAVI